MKQSIKKISLAQRMGKVSQFKGKLPRAIGLYDFDFFDEVGAMTAQEERYRSIFEKEIKPYRDTDDDTMERMYTLVTRADELEDSDRQNLLFWLLVEPFATIQNQQNN